MHTIVNKKILVKIKNLYLSLIKIGKSTQFKVVCKIKKHTMISYKRKNTKNNHQNYYHMRHQEKIFHYQQINYYHQIYKKLKKKIQIKYNNYNK
jgi:hypothetical protein